MTIEEVQNRIVERFDSYWQDTALEHVNTAIDKSKLEEWARLSIIHSPAKRFSFTNAAKRGGAVSVQVFVKDGTGQGRAVSLAVKAGQYIMTLSTGTLRFEPFDIRVVGNKASDALTTTETSWFQVNCFVDFTFID